MDCPSEPIRVAEDGEIMGQLCQFARSFNMTRKAVLKCLRDHAPEAVILRAGKGLDQLLILDAEALRALQSYAQQQTAPLRTSAASALRA
ncbi:MAG: hypothetical protein PPP56_02985 [Longimonas sp.]|uniref:hypothetical protein n=1 Tax=Longimonas sp. TaxID=2039626 RepID=UPI003348201E